MKRLILSAGLLQSRVPMQRLLTSGKVSIISLLILLVAVAGAFLISGRFDQPLAKKADIAGTSEAKAKENLPSQFIDIPAGETFAELMEVNGFGSSDVYDMIEASRDVYDLATVRAGKKIELYQDNAGVLQKLIYNINTEEYLQIIRKQKEVISDQELVTSNKELVISEEESETALAETESEWVAEKIKVPYEVKIETAQATVKDILYTSALEAGIDELLVLDIADVFQWQVDFALDIRNGDSFKVIYEARYLDGQYVMPGKILAAEFINQGTPYHVYYFEESADNIGYFDENGNSTQKMFLKAPVAYRYISSGFTTGRRYVSAFNVSTGHRAIDYAASSGTPIRATADGTVTFAGWSRAGYGNLTTIRHNGTFSTNYAHQSKFAVKTGQKVKQGQTIGYVGSTGFSTGPHLHYELVKNGVKVNPQTEILPPGQKLKEGSMEAFQKIVSDLDQQLGAIK